MKKYIVYILLCVMFIAGSGFSLPSFSSMKKDLTTVKELYDGEYYQELYDIFLAEIPRFNERSRYAEELFYFYALTCIALQKYDEAEGYLYTVSTAKDELAYPQDYDLIWAQLCDGRGDIRAAYERYRLFVNVYPDTSIIPQIQERLDDLQEQIADTLKEKEDV